jgi:hypothetical protein
MGYAKNIIQNLFNPPFRKIVIDTLFTAGVTMVLLLRSGMASV